MSGSLANRYMTTRMRVAKPLRFPAVKLPLDKYKALCYNRITFKKESIMFEYICIYPCVVIVLFAVLCFVKEFVEDFINWLF